MINALKRLRPMHDLAKGGARPGWIVGGDDPQFDVSVPAWWPPGGHWCMLELTLKATPRSGAAKFYFDFGEGVSEATAVALPWRSGGLVKRLCYFPSRPTAIRFDPMETQGELEVEHLRLAWVAPWFAHDRMLRRLVPDGENQPQAKRDLKSKLKSSAEKNNTRWVSLLRQHYDATFHVPAGSATYSEWIEGVETPYFQDAEAHKARMADFAWQPLISIILPTYNSEEKYLRACLDSVLAQWYSNWELCVADDASTMAGVREVLDEYAQCDKRIKVCYREENGHICAASNTALAMATGQYVALLDHDDMLAPQALYCVVDALNENPKAQLIYSDEDKLDEGGQRFGPHFKSDWNPDLLLSHNYITHLSVYAKELVQTLGGFRAGVEGAQDYDLVLRCTQQLSAEHIIHIPWVLYHWRAAGGSTALAASKKDYTTQAGLKALQYLMSCQNKNVDVDVDVEAGPVPNSFRVRYPIPEKAPLVSLLIPTRDKLDFVKRCLTSILEKTTYPNFEILILDNQSSEQATLDWFSQISELPQVRVMPYNKPFNFSAINNFGVQYANGAVLGFLNNDLEVINGEWLTEMVSHAIRPEIGCVGAKLYYSDDTIQHAGVVLGIGGVAGHSHKYSAGYDQGYFSRLLLTQNYSAVTGACLVIRKEVFECVDGFNEQNLAVAFNDIDLCLKVREAGFRTLWTPYAELYHHESVSRGGEDTPEKLTRFNSEVHYMQETWSDQLLCDPCYNRNLTLERENFGIRKCVG